MKLRDIPRAWKNEIRNNPTGKFAKRAMSVQKRIGDNNAWTKFLEKVTRKSDVGTRLMKLFTSRVGAIPCGRCKNTMNALNKKSVEEILNDRESIANEIFVNSKEASVSLWARLLSYADDKLNDGKVTTFMIQRWLEEACREEQEWIDKVNADAELRKAEWQARCDQAELEIEAEDGQE
ncbi:MAG: hypothetical protein E6R03_08095 [Hyphomicrobiaceae bacterium]|nr:MAG: hypothetical protein E6R03_08095 [Hyphomicrobiaceae bacterium]